MSKEKESIKLAKIIKALSGDDKLEHIANVIDKISIKDSEQIREIVPIFNRNIVRLLYWKG